MHRFRNILVVADAASMSDAVIARARWLAEANGAALTLIDVMDDEPGEFARLIAALPGTRRREIEARVAEVHRSRLDALAAPLTEAGLAVGTEVLQGTGFVEIIRHVLRHGNDLVLKGAQRTPDRKVLRGPDLHLLRKCPCPVWILNSAAEPHARRIMAAVDPDPDDDVRGDLSCMVMELATSLALQDDAKLDVVNAWFVREESALRHSLAKIPDDEIEAILRTAERQSSERLKRLMAGFTQFEGQMRVLHLKGDPADIVVEHAESERIDTVVMGTVGRTGIAGLFIGNTAETVLNRVGCSVLTAKPRGFRSPITLNEGADA